jgi:NAD(P)-dependent dehydrogenase (short-subunit alcohol dehydrogenase family)
VHDPALALIVVYGVVLDTAVVPERNRIRPPSEATGEFRPYRMPIEPPTSPYGASKAALGMATEVWAKEVEGTGPDDQHRQMDSNTASLGQENNILYSDHCYVHIWPQGRDPWTGPPVWPILNRRQPNGHTRVGVALFLANAMWNRIFYNGGAISGWVALFCYCFGRLETSVGYSNTGPRGRNCNIFRRFGGISIFYLD